MNRKFMRSAQENANLGQSRGERKIRNWREVLKKMQNWATEENIKLEIDEKLQNTVCTVNKGQQAYPFRPRDRFGSKLMAFVLTFSPPLPPSWALDGCVHWVDDKIPRKNRAGITSILVAIPGDRFWVTPQRWLRWNWRKLLKIISTLTAAEGDCVTNLSQDERPKAERENLNYASFQTAWGHK